jgi:hypothetical protein
MDRKQHYNKPYENESWVINKNLYISGNVRTVINTLGARTAGLH